MDIIITTPKSRIAEAAKEAEECKRDGGGYYFRVIKRPGSAHAVGDKVWYTEAGYVRGYCVVVEILRPTIGPWSQWMQCATTGRSYLVGGDSILLYMDATTWTWIDPIPMAGFQGWRYFKPFEHLIREVGDWRSKMPEINGGTE